MIPPVAGVHYNSSPQLSGGMGMGVGVEGPRNSANGQSEEKEVQKG